MATLYMMVGLPGSGKSAYADNLPNVVVHSSDKIREEILGDVNDQSQQDRVFDVMKHRVWDDLKAGKDVVYDATNVNTKRRRHFLTELSQQRIPDVVTKCVLMATPYTECLRRNNERERKVPARVMWRMLKSFDPPMCQEGWDEVNIVDAECDRVLEFGDMMQRLIALEHDNPHHSLTVGQHCIATAQLMRTRYGTSEDYAINVAALLHDIGKLQTKSFFDSKGNRSEIAHYYDHEHVGAYDSFQYTRAYTDDVRLRVATLIRYHMYPFAIEKSSNPEKTKQKLQKLVGMSVFDDLMRLHECDVDAH